MRGVSRVVPALEDQVRHGALEQVAVGADPERVVGPASRGLAERAAIDRVAERLGAGEQPG